MTTKRIITGKEVMVEVARVARELSADHAKPGYRIYGVPRGGLPVALALAARTFYEVVESPHLADFIVDDIWDSGKTAARFAQYDKPFLVLFDKRLPQWKDQWLVMPWEITEDNDQSADDIVTRLFQYIGEDPNREGLLETPRRFLQGWKEWAQGYAEDPKVFLKCFEDGAASVNEMVIVHNIPVISKCEHHLADIVGIAHVGYIPNGKIVGLSKLARLVDCYARRLQVQERMTNQIAQALQDHVSPLGVGVYIRAAHHCMLTRGVKVHGSVTTTSAMRGALLDKPEARAEFMALCAAAEKG